MFDSLTHKRPYKEAWPVEKALSEIQDLDGKKFDPRVVEAFFDLRGAFIEALEAEAEAP